MIDDYNRMFDKGYDTKTFQAYFSDVSKKVKNTEIDILLVVNMFLHHEFLKYTLLYYVFFHHSSILLLYQLLQPLPHLQDPQ